MSFIRSGSNPEALYVYHSIAIERPLRKEGFISFSGHDGVRKTDTGDRYGLVIPPKDFYKVCEKYEKLGCEEMLRVGDFGIQEVTIESKTGGGAMLKLLSPSFPVTKPVQLTLATAPTFQPKISSRVVTTSKAWSRMP